jgi:hypothetical protein
MLALPAVPDQMRLPANQAPKDHPAHPENQDPMDHPATQERPPRTSRSDQDHPESPEMQDPRDHPAQLESPAKMANQDHPDRKDRRARPDHLERMDSPDHKDHPAHPVHRARRASARNTAPWTAAYSSRTAPGDRRTPATLVHVVAYALVLPLNCTSSKGPVNLHTTRQHIAADEFLYVINRCALCFSIDPLCHRQSPS